MAAVQHRRTDRNVRSGRPVKQSRNVSGSSRTQRPGYVYGNTVRKPDIREEIEKAPARRLSNTTRKNREKAEHMSPGYVLFLSIALIAMGWILLNYIKLQSDITNTINQISSLERELNDLKLSNDEEYNRITSSVDLEEVRRIAIQELGMTYAQEGQIITFTSENNDYVKQISSIP